MIFCIMHVRTARYVFVLYIQNHVKHIYSVNYNNFITAIDLPTINILI